MRGCDGSRPRPLTVNIGSSSTVKSGHASCEAVRWWVCSGLLEPVTCQDTLLADLSPLWNSRTIDREGVAIHEIPGIAPQLALHIVDQPGRAEEPERLAAPQGDTKNGVESDEMVHVCMRDKNFASPEQSGRSQTFVVPEIKEQGSLGPANLHIDAGIAEDIVDQIAGEGRIHERTIHEILPDRRSHRTVHDDDLDRMRHDRDPEVARSEPDAFPR